jgi:hypothetical protein
MAIKVTPLVFLQDCVTPGQAAQPALTATPSNLICSMIAIPLSESNGRKVPAVCFAVAHPDRVAVVDYDPLNDKIVMQWWSPSSSSPSALALASAGALAKE